jgi:hypothetical protein
LPPDGAQEESILANNIQRSNKEEECTKEKTTRLRPRKTPQHISTQNQLKTLKFSTILIKQQKHETLPSISCSRKKRMTRNNFMKANHLYLMNSNYYREICKKTTTSKYH